MNYNIYQLTKILQNLNSIVKGVMQIVDDKIGGNTGSMTADTTNRVICKVTKDLDMILDDWKKRKTAICIELGKIETADREREGNPYREDKPDETDLRIRGEGMWSKFLSEHEINICEGCEECERGVNDWPLSD